MESGQSAGGYSELISTLSMPLAFMGLAKPVLKNLLIA